MTRNYRHTLAMTCIAILLSHVAAEAAIIEYSDGHGDIGLAFEDGNLELHFHFAAGAVLDGVPITGDLEPGPSEAYVRVGDQARFATTEDIPFLGTQTSAPIWVLPQSNTGGLPFLGIAAEELDSTFTSAMISLSDFNGPGEFALWQAVGVSGVDVSMQTSDGIDDALDRISLDIGGHDHFNYGFTAEGVYDLEFTAVAELAAGGSLTDVGTFRFVVGDATAVPEPGSLLALGVAVAGFGWRRKRAMSARN